MANEKTTTTQTANFFKNFLKAQSEFTSLAKDTEAFNYKYATLDSLVNMVRPILAKNGLGYFQSVNTFTDRPGTWLQTYIYDADGPHIQSEVLLPEIDSNKNNKAQTLGMAITYMRRYTLSVILGITSDEDTDAITEPNRPQQANRQQQSQNNRNQAPTGPGPRTNKPQQQPPKKEAPAEFVGGPDTPEQHKRINEMLAAKYPNGRPVFSKEDISAYGKSRITHKTADQLIADLEAELNKRMPPMQKAADLVSNEDLDKAAEAALNQEPVQEFKDDLEIF